MAEYVGMLSAKGGSGKTSLAMSCASFLAGLGYATVVVDIDAATNGATVFWLDELNRTRETLHGAKPLGILEKDVYGGFAEDPRQVGGFMTSAGFALIPASYSLDSQTADSRRSIGPDELADRLGDLTRRLKSDYVFVDTEAGSETSSVVAAELCDRIVIASEFDPASVRGIKRLERLHPEVFKLDNTWTVFNKVLPELAGSIGAGLQVFNVLPPVVWEIDVVRSYSVGQLNVSNNSPNEFTLNVAAMMEALLGHEARDRIAAWKRESASVSRRALEVERADLMSQLSDSVEAASRRLSRATIGALAIAALASLVSVIGATLNDSPVRVAVVASGVGILFASLFVGQRVTPEPADLAASNDVRMLRIAEIDRLLNSPFLRRGGHGE